MDPNPAAQIEAFQHLKTFAPFYGEGLVIGCLILIPACIASVMMGRPIAKDCPLDTLWNRTAYVSGGAMYFGLIFLTYRLKSIHPTICIGTALFLPYWPALILRPLLWIEKLKSFASRLRISAQPPQEPPVSQWKLAVKTRPARRQNKPKVTESGGKNSDEGESEG